MFIFAGHGCKKDELYMQDEIKVKPLESIVLPLLPGDCNELGSIPKVFLIDACRGTLKTKTTLTPRGSIDQEESVHESRGGIIRDMHVVPAEGNFLLARSTLPRHKAYEDNQKGGLWLSQLAELLSDLKMKMSIDDILTKVNENLMEKQQGLSEYIQQPVKQSLLIRTVFLEPCKLTRFIYFPRAVCSP